VLETLLLRAGKVVPKQAIIESLADFDDDLSANAVEQYVSRLRKRLAPYGLTVRTARGLGYYLDKAKAGMSAAAYSLRRRLLLGAARGPARASASLALLDTWREAQDTATRSPTACWPARRWPSPSAWWSPTTACSRSTCPMWRSRC
jgi:hypothetical protein